ncbi:LysM domain-containing protein [Paenarthrobacter sp. NPDC089322]|uniref:LysM peptidoglycan-binding domain-containing protein n=1 Tax=Paenarthrobacter sp. NPDC089322 TaxID=3155065 RepID=UPI00341C596E
MGDFMSGRDQVVRRDGGTAVTLLGLGLLLLIIGKAVLSQQRAAMADGQGLIFEHLLGLVVSGAGLAVVAWWVLTLGFALAAAALKRTGRDKSATAVAKFSPSFMLRLACATLSLNLVGLNAAFAAAPPEPGPGSPSLSVPASGAGWQVSTDIPAQHLLLASVPDLLNEAEKHDPAESGPGWRPQPPVVEPGLLARESSRAAGFGGPSADAVVVMKGDTLWSIAAARLGPLATDLDVALSWPQWFAANRSVIGDNPAALLPGQVLQPPPPG